MTSLAWELLATHTNSVLAAERPRAYLMSAAAQALTNEARAQRYLTGSSSSPNTTGTCHVISYPMQSGEIAA